ncbi:hypothetical protein VE04_02492 [Pseudogymnoascus sp. 24MN13]|nr:hypothetical protein VE04_02492 [Pseudogymnoascus sp. 24MN13]
MSASPVMDLTEGNPQTVHNESSDTTVGFEDSTDIEKVSKEEELQGKENPTLRLDKHGLQLVPQPTAFKDDPLNWSPALKLLVALQVSWLALLGPMGSAVVNPAFVPLAKSFKIPIVQASYELTVFIVFAGVGPLLITPFSNVYGRRPIYLLGNLVAGVTNVIAGNCTTWNGLLVTRVFNGIGAGSSVAIGAATICDLYFVHERGFYMGIFTFFLTNGPHFAPLIGGFIAQNLSWRWCFTIPGYIQLATFVITLFCLPETIYSRKTVNIATHREHSYLDLLLFKRSVLPGRKLHLADFGRSLYMLKYVSIVIPGLYYMTCFGYESVLFAVTGSHLFSEFYNFDVAQTGLVLSIPLLIGCLIGEANAGWLVDWMANRYAKKNDGHRKPEVRLDAIWFALLIPIGIVVEGVCLSQFKNTSWVGSAFGMGLACLGLQVATTVIYTYCTDCYKSQSPEISSLLNVFRSVFSMIISFYAIPLGTAIKYQYAWLVFALINALLLIPMFALKFYGEKWRSSSWQTPPKFHNDI